MNFTCKSNRFYFFFSLTNYETTLQMRLVQMIFCTWFWYFHYIFYFHLFTCVQLVCSIVEMRKLQNKLCKCVRSGLINHFWHIYTIFSVNWSNLFQGLITLVHLDSRKNWMITCNEMAIKKYNCILIWFSKSNKQMVYFYFIGNMFKRTFQRFIMQN